MSALLTLQGITKAFPSVVANDGISLSVSPGEIHAVLGENGAGKSTLMKIIYGVSAPDAGTIHWQGEPVTIASPAHAHQLGIGMVFQHFSLFETLTVTENMSLALPGSRTRLRQDIASASNRFGLAVDPDATVKSLSVGERQRVEILRCLLQSPKLIIMDEPTSVLPPQGIGELFKTLRRLADDGLGILFISHKLDEIRALCDTATVLRHGKVTGHAVPREESDASLTSLMIGRELPHTQRPASERSAAPLLSVSGLSVESNTVNATALRSIAFEVHGGEIVGIAGVSGNGQNLLSSVLSGEHPLPPGQADRVRLDGAATGHNGPSARRDLGLRFVPEERLGRGAVPVHDLRDNGLLTGFNDGLSRLGFRASGAMHAFAERTIGAFDVRCGGPAAEAQSLSGGNLQKYIVGRELSLTPRVLLVSQPTWGVDVGAASDIRQRLVDLSRQGVAVLVISEELEELFEISDRMHVMFRGTLSPPVATEDTTVEAIGLAMTGNFDALAATAEGSARV
ncbi:MAG: ABC transporter ATP-binding protein [Pseudomonadota bacterium]